MAPVLDKVWRQAGGRIAVVFEEQGDRLITGHDGLLGRHSVCHRGRCRLGGGNGEKEGRVSAADPRW